MRNKSPKFGIELGHFFGYNFQAEFLGWSGVVRLDPNGDRSDFRLDILQLGPKSLHRDNPFQLIASWFDLF
jgi:hypothetical protein